MNIYLVDATDTLHIRKILKQIYHNTCLYDHTSKTKIILMTFKKIKNIICLK